MTEPVEFAIIRRYFSGADRGPGVVLGIGDDAAILAPEPGERLAVTVDSLVGGVHFPLDAPPEDVGYRALAVNLSDLAAMGATPRWALLALTVPHTDEDWLAAFARGFLALAAQHEVALVGGNLSRGPWAATVQLTGTLPSGAWLSRAGAQPGDRLLVSGTLGDAAAGLRAWQAGERDRSVNPLLERFLRPSPRVALGREALGCANAGIDLSDGLLADLQHVCTASGVGAHVQLEALPMSQALRAAATADAEELALSGGDDYELLLCVPPSDVERLRAAATRQGVALTDIGCILAEAGVKVTRDGVAVTLDAAGFEHFARSVP